MSKLESAIVGLFVGIACPFLTFTGFWWSAALLHAHISEFPLQTVKVSAMAGLALGLLLDVLFLRSWIRRFYVANLWLMSIFYLCLCFVAVASFMGLPVGTFTLGIIAGVYMGRRGSHQRKDLIQIAPALRRTALLAAMVTSLAALPIGVLALNEQDILDKLGSLSGIKPSSFQGWAGVIFLSITCILLFLVQYGCSKKAGWIAYNSGDTSHNSCNQANQLRG